MGAQRLQPHLVYIIHCRRPAVDPRQIGRSRLEAVGHIGGDLLGIGHTPGAACQKRLHLGGEVGRDQQGTDALRPQQTLVGGHCQSAEAESLEIHRHMARTLSAIQQEGDLMKFT